jgi:23S rRNA (uracil1939-C5)-methyltransferase
MEYQIKIEKYSKRGHGLGSFRKTPDSPEVSAEVVGTVVGDTAHIELQKKKRRTYAATLKEIVHPSKDRVPAKCKHVGVCGGCTWQQKSYEAQLKIKEAHIETLFGQKPLPIIPADNPWHYRNKMEYTFSQNKEGEKFLGLMIARSRGRVLNLDECFLTNPWFIAVLESVREWWNQSALLAYHPYSDQGTLRTLTLREGKRTGEKMAFLTISGNPDFMIHKTALEGFKEAVVNALPEEDPSIFLRIQQIAKGTPTTFYEMHLHGPDFIDETLIIKGKEIYFKISPDSFFQPNPVQAEKLYTRALELVAPQSTDIVFDLYCGTATLGIIFAPYVKEVIGMELNPYSICDGELNIAVNDLSNITLQKGDVGALLKNIDISPDLAIIDPPRSGLDPTALKHLIRLSPRKILYISCNPTTQAQNISLLREAGYVLEVLQGVDQFPHTYHLENIAILSKGASGD